MKKFWFILFMMLVYCSQGISQVEKATESKILFSGIVRDASTLAPLPDAQIRINRSFVAASDRDGTFALRVSRRDTVVFTLLGYQNAGFYVSESLVGTEFMAGVYLKTDTLSIGEVIIMPRIKNLKYDILKASPAANPEIENAKYNLKVAAYQGKVTTGSLGDPSSNYAVLKSRFRTNAYEKGGIPSSSMVQLSPLLLLPAAYLLMNGIPDRPAPMKSNLTKQELDQIHERYIESLQKKK